MTKKVTILGAGESGTGAALLGRTKGLDVFVSDLNSIADRYKDDLVRNKIEFEEGGHTESRILDADVVVKSPGIPDDAEVIRKVRAAGLEVIDELEFAFPFIEGDIIAITGTNGKTTTALLTHHLLKMAGFNAVLAGNVGESLARKVANGKHEWYVVEVSSFQLDGTKAFRPRIGILLNITPDHLNRYQDSIQRYADSKFRLIANMTEKDHFIYYADDPVIAEEIRKRHNIVPQRLRISLKTGTIAPLYFDGEKMVFNLQEVFDIAQVETTLRGPHNLINTMAAVTAAKLAGSSLKAILAGLKNFKNAPHRLESIARIEGVEFVNDSKATNVDSVMYALNSFHQSLIWIAGGIDKGNDYGRIVEEVRKKVKVLICLGADNEKLVKAFGGVVPEIHETRDMHELVEVAMKAAKPGDVVLLSPACASFDLFKNYEDRGDQFRRAVLALKNEKHHA